MGTDAAFNEPRGLVPFAQLRLASDRSLVEQVQVGSERAFEALFDRHRAPLLAFCRQLLGSPEEAEDVVQQTFLVAYSELLRSASPRAPRPWLYGIARHRCLTVLRARRRSRVEAQPEPAVDHLAAAVTTRDELRAILTDVARLPDDQRTALVLAEFGDVPHEQIAAFLGCPRDKVKALVYQARSSLAASRRARDTPCAEIREQLTTLRGAALRRTSLRRHIRDCAGCRAFRDEVRSQRSRLSLGLPVFPIAAVERVFLGAASGSGGGTGVAAVSVGTLSGGGLVATALVTVAIPLGAMTVRAIALDDGGTGPPRLAPAAPATVDAGHPGPAAPDRTLTEPSATERARETFSASAPRRDVADADAWPSPAEVAGTHTRPLAPENRTAHEETGQATGSGRPPADDHSVATDPGRPAANGAPLAPPPAGRAAPPRRSGEPRPDPPAPSPAPRGVRQPAPTTRAVPPRGHDRPTPGPRTAPVAAPKATPAPPPAPPKHDPAMAPAQQRANTPAPATRVTPSPPVAPTQDAAANGGRR